MRRIKDPFPPTPARFHLRVEETLMSLENRDVNKRRVPRRVALLAAILAALLALAAAASVAGRTHFRDRLDREGASEVSALVQEVHRGSVDDGSDGFRFSIDELIWEGDDLYVSYSLAVPEGGRWLVAMFTPTLDGEKLTCDPRGFTAPKFIDPDEGAPAVLLLGGSHRSRCSELWTFSVDPRAALRDDSRLAFRAVLFRTDLDLAGTADWTDLMDPPEAIPFGEWAGGEIGTEQRRFMDDVTAALSGGVPPLEALTATGHAERADERTIALDLNADALPAIAYNDVAVHDCDVKDFHLHVDAFRMTHLGISIDFTMSIPGATRQDRRAMARYNELINANWAFGTPDGRPLGYSLGATGGATLDAPEGGSAVYRFSLKDSLVLPLRDLGDVLLAPCEYRDGADGQSHAVYDMDSAVTLTPIHADAAPGR